MCYYFKFFLKSIIVLCNSVNLRRKAFAYWCVLLFVIPFYVHKKHRKNFFVKMYFFIKLQFVCFITLLLLIAELVLDHFTHSLTLLVVAWQTLYNFISLFISSVSIALSHNNSRELQLRVRKLVYKIISIYYMFYNVLNSILTRHNRLFYLFYNRVHLDGEEQVSLVHCLA